MSSPENLKAGPFETAPVTGGAIPMKYPLVLLAVP